MGKSLLDREERKRGKMYLLLLLLVSPAFGRPSNALFDVGVDISNQLESIVGFNEETKDIFDSIMFEKISGSLQEAEQNILEMEVQLKTFESQELTFEDNYFPAYNEAKTYLRETRQDLRKLAHRTVTDVRDLKTLLKALDENNKDPLFLKKAIAGMKALMIDTLETLKEAREKYNLALETFDNLKSTIATHNRKLEKMVNTNSAEYKAWTQNVRIGVYGTIGATTVGCIIADALGALGICSAVSIAASASAAAGIEVEITKYRIEMEKLVTITGRMLESGKSVDQEIKGAIDILTEEINLIVNWANSAEVVSKNIDNYPQEYLKKYISIRTVFINGLDDLKTAAEKFLAQPTYIL